MRQRTAMLAIAVALFAPAMVGAQSTSAGQLKRRPAPEAARAERARRELLEKLDSLRWEVEHERLSTEERERLGKEMAVALRALDESMAQMQAIEVESAVEAARAARVWSTSPQVRVMMRSSSRPRGYLGLSFDGPNTEDVRDEELFIRFYQYPMIALVEPSSPAERAGIRKGDTLLALNGTDVVKNEIALTRMLQPDEKVTVRVRRGRDTKNLAVIVGLAPDYVVRRLMAPTPMASTYPPRAVRAPDAPTAVSPAPSAAPPAFVWEYNTAIAGAKVETVSEEWGRTLGVGSGVLIVRAMAGTPAHESGLRDGDVIIRASGRTISGVRDLRNALASSESDEGVKIVVVRERKQREMTLRWN